MQKQRLEWRLAVAEEARQSHLDRWRRGPVRISGPALVAALKSVEAIQDRGIGAIDLSQFPPGRINTLAR